MRRGPRGYARSGCAPATAAMESLRRRPPRSALGLPAAATTGLFRDGLQAGRRSTASGSRACAVQHSRRSQIVLPGNTIHAVDDAAARLARIEDQIRTLLPILVAGARVEAIQANARTAASSRRHRLMARTGTSAARTIHASWMSWASGSVAVQYSSGPTDGAGAAFTKAGSKDARRMLIEGGLDLSRATRLVGKVHMARLRGPSTGRSAISPGKRKSGSGARVIAAHVARGEPATFVVHRHSHRRTGRLHLGHRQEGLPEHPPASRLLAEIKEAPEPA